MNGLPHKDMPHSFAAAKLLS